MAVRVVSRGAANLQRAFGDSVFEKVAADVLPSIFAIRAHVDEGGLISYGLSYHALFNRAATYIDKILKGERPADLTLADVPRGSRPGERRGLRRSLFAFVPADSGL
jgi:ABC-type uncharacterized transport system substrate-binding protein